jgi:hypothetical protein
MKTKIWNTIESIHYSALIALFVLILIVCCAHHTQSYSAQSVHRAEFEQCIADEPSDAVCDSCWTVVLSHHNYWFNNDLYNDATISLVTKE